MQGEDKHAPAQRDSAASHSRSNLASKRAQRAPRLPIHGRTHKSIAPAAKSADENNAARSSARHHPASVDETIEILSRHPEWVSMKAKFGARLRAVGVPENSVKDVSDAAVRRILECKRKGVDAETIKWAFAWDILEKYIFPDLSENKKKRFRLYAQRIASMELTPRERQISFYVVWGLGNKEIADKIGTGKDNVNKHVQKIRRKLGIGPVAVDDRLATVLNLLGL